MKNIINDNLDLSLSDNESNNQSENESDNKPDMDLIVYDENMVIYY